VTAIDTVRKTAKRWLRALQAGDPDARARLLRVWPDAPADVTLRDVQHALARERGHTSWHALKRAVTTEPSAPSTLVDLLNAAGHGDAAAVAAILDSHPALINQRGLLPGNTGLRTALHYGSGHEAVVRTLLERGADPNIRDEGDNAYPLHFAAQRGDLPIVKLLLEYGADPIGSGTTHELDVIGWAVCFDDATHVDVARCLLSHGATHTVFSAVALGEIDAVHTLAAEGADLNQRMDRTNQRRTPLHLAIVKKQPAALRALIELGADLNLTDAVGLTALDHATLGGELDMARMLLEAGADLSLPAAIVLERHDVVERILRDDPNRLSTTDNRGWARLLVHASARGSAAVIETLLRTVMRHRAGLTIVNMADDEETAVDGASRYTALHAAAFNGNDDVVRVLLRHGANPRVRDGKYCGTPAGWAAYAGHHRTAELLLEADIDIFDAIEFDRADRVHQILDLDAGAIDRPFTAYADCVAKEQQWWPGPNVTPLEWATRRGKQNAARALIERAATARSADDQRRAQQVVAFLRSACWDEQVHGKATHRMHDHAAARLLAADPRLAHESLYTAIVCGDLQNVARSLALRPEAAHLRGGARGWTPMLYMAYTRFSHPATHANALAIARLLLDAGANPNDFYMAGDARYSVLTGVAGEGEQDAPRQPYASALFDLLLERDAEPFDIQVLYNTHFSGDMLWWLELVYKRTTGTHREAAWKDPEWTMFDMGAYGSGARFLLEVAIKKHDVHLTRWLLEHGASPNAAPARDKRFWQHSLYALAHLENVPEIAAMLEEYGADSTRPALTAAEQLLQAALHGERDLLKQLLTEHPQYLESPAVLFEAARHNRPDALALLHSLGFGLDLQDHTGKRALHEAAFHGALEAVRWLVEHGADVDLIESAYEATPLGWAAHADRQRVMDFLSRHSRDLWTLCFRGYIDRVRDVLRQDAALARATRRSGHTLLWWLPDDEDEALRAVELLLHAGADPSAHSADNRTAADAARDRGMQRVAARLLAAAGAQEPPTPIEGD
jgi:ankyrin repeat protein